MPNKFTYTSIVKPDGGNIFIETEDLQSFVDAMATLGLVTVTPGTGNGATPVAPVEAEPAAKRGPGRPPKAAAPVAEPVAAPAEPVAAAPTPAEAATVIRAFGSKHGVDKAKALLTSLGFNRTSDITPEKAQAVIDAVAEADL